MDVTSALQIAATGTQVVLFLDPTFEQILWWTISVDQLHARFASVQVLRGSVHSTAKQVQAARLHGTLEAVFFLSGVTRQWEPWITGLGQHLDFGGVRIFTSADELLAEELHQEYDSHEMMAGVLMHKLGSSIPVHVHYLPVNHFCMLGDPDLWIFPSCGLTSHPEETEPIRGDRLSVQFRSVLLQALGLSGTTGGRDLEIFPPALQRSEDTLPLREELTCLASGVATSLAKCGWKAELYGCGPLSCMLGSTVRRFLDATEYAAGDEAVVVMLDRSLDLVAPLATADHLLDQIFRKLAPCPRQPDDVHIPMKSDTLLFRSLAQPSPTASACIFTPKMWTLESSASAAMLWRQLSSDLHANPPKALNSDSFAQLQPLTSGCEEVQGEEAKDGGDLHDVESRHSVARAAELALQVDASNSRQQTQHVAFERLLMWLCTREQAEQSCMEHLRDYFVEQENLSLQEAFRLTVLCLSAMGESCVEYFESTSEGQELLESVVGCLVGMWEREREKQQMPKLSAEDMRSQEESLQSILLQVPAQRSKDGQGWVDSAILGEAREGEEGSNIIPSVAYQILLALLEEEGEHFDYPGVASLSPAGIGSLLSSFWGSSSQLMQRVNVLVVLVVGGVSSLEIRHLRRLMQQHPAAKGKRLVVCSTSMCRPDSVLGPLLTASQLEVHPSP